MSSGFSFTSVLCYTRTMDSDEKPTVLAVVGPTASGKTDLAVTLAEAYNGEVISADSRQVYRGLDIGTAKVTQEEKRGIPHHLIDIVDINTIYTGQDFVRDASQAIADITSRGKLPIIAGGTFFYLELLRGTMQAAPVPPNYQLRAELAEQNTTELYTELKKRSPNRALRIDPQNRRRIIRALEITAALGRVPQANTTAESPYEMFMIALSVEKESLRNRFQDRAAAWLKQGFQTEVEGLLEQGISRQRLEEIGFEYTLMLSYLDKEISKVEFTQRFVEKNWQYAKRQLTWLKRDVSIHWVDPLAPLEVTALKTAIGAWLER